MPPKKRAAAKAKKAPATKRKASAKAAPAAKRAKKQLIEEEEEEEEVEEEVPEATEEEPSASSKADIIKQLRDADANKTSTKKHTPDKFIPSASNYQVLDDYDAMLNQTNIGANNNKFYVIQVLKQAGNFYAWTRWGRVGETGSNGMFGPFSSADGAIKQFEAKFKDKTRNDWKKRDQFKKVAGKYDLIDVAGQGDDEEEEEKATSVNKSATVEAKDGTIYAASKLDDPTQSLIRLIFDTDMFKDAMKTFDIDVKKMPLGKLSKVQIAKGFEILEELEAVMENKKKGTYNELSSRFYTAIPHDFGRMRPKPIDTREALQQKYDMLAVLADIEIAQSIQKNKKDEEEEAKKSTVPHPYDVNYGLLKCTLEHVDAKSEEFQVIKKYTDNTQGYRKCTILDAWRVDRAGEGNRFAEFTKMGNRKLLWHGTSVAVVVAILKSGLRIMPHSGGRVGKGIYFASENGKSSGYVGTSPDQGKQIGIMFLNEVALGKEHGITADNSSFKKAPAGFDSVVARGQTEPDPKDDTSLTIGGNEVAVPAGKPIKTTYSSSSFAQSEYLIYEENQCRIRYLLKMQF